MTPAAGTGLITSGLAARWFGRPVDQRPILQYGGSQGDSRQFSIESASRARLVSNEIIAGGAAAIARSDTALKDPGRTLALSDASRDRDGAAIAAALSKCPLVGRGAWVGPQLHAPEPTSRSEPVVNSSGALDRQTVFQRGAARALMAVCVVEFSAPDPVANALVCAGPRIGAPIIIAESASPDRVPPDRVPPDRVPPDRVPPDRVRPSAPAAAVLGAIARSRKPRGAGSKNLFLSEFEPQIRLNAPAE